MSDGQGEGQTREESNEADRHTYSEQAGRIKQLVRKFRLNWEVKPV